MPRSFYTPVEARLAQTLQQQARSIEDAQRATGTEKNRSLLKLGEAVSAQQVLTAELQARASASLPGSAVTVATQAPGGQPGDVAWNDGQRQFTLPDPTGGRRRATLSVSGDLDGSNSSGSSMPTAHIVLLYGNAVVASDMWNVPRSGAAGYPPAWSNRFRLAADIDIAASPSLLTVRLYVSAYFGGGTMQITMSGLVATIAYGQRV